MKNIAFSSILLSLILLTACEYEILDSKPGVSLDPIINLQHTLTGPEVTFTWSLPSLPSEIPGPISVRINVTRDGLPAGTITLPNNPTTYKFITYNSQYSYRFVFKVIGSVVTDDPFLSKQSISPGVVAVI